MTLKSLRPRERVERAIIGRDAEVVSTGMTDRPFAIKTDTIVSSSVLDEIRACGLEVVGVTHAKTSTMVHVDWVEQ